MKKSLLFIVIFLIIFINGCSNNPKVYKPGDEIKFSPNGKDTYTWNVLTTDDSIDKTEISILMNQIIGENNCFDRSIFNKNGLEKTINIDEYLENLTKDWDYKARLVTLNELLNAGCTIEKETCPKWITSYLVDNDYNMSYWTETLCNGTDCPLDNVWIVTDTGTLTSTSKLNSSGVRVVLNIPKKNIK